MLLIPLSVVAVPYACQKQGVDRSLLPRLARFAAFCLALAAGRVWLFPRPLFPRLPSRRSFGLLFLCSSGWPDFVLLPLIARSARFRRVSWRSRLFGFARVLAGVLRRFAPSSRV